MSRRQMIYIEEYSFQMSVKTQGLFLAHRLFALLVDWGNQEEDVWSKYTAS
jgi:hypothetical protein